MTDWYNTSIVIASIFAICVIAVATSYFFISQSNVGNDKYGKPLDDNGNFTAFGEKWICYKTGVQMECLLQ